MYRGTSLERRTEKNKTTRGKRKEEEQGESDNYNEQGLVKHEANHEEDEYGKK